MKVLEAFGCLRSEGSDSIALSGISTGGGKRVEKGGHRTQGGVVEIGLMILNKHIQKVPSFHFFEDDM